MFTDYYHSLTNGHSTDALEFLHRLFEASRNRFPCISLCHDGVVPQNNVAQWGRSIAQVNLCRNKETRLLQSTWRNTRRNRNACKKEWNEKGPVIRRTPPRFQLEFLYDYLYSFRCCIFIMTHSTWHYYVYHYNSFFYFDVLIINNYMQILYYI